MWERFLLKKIFKPGMKMRGQIWGVLILFSLLISATLRISSAPAGAQIYLDGNYSYRGIYLGNAGDSSNPLVVSGLSAQRHFLQLVLPGYMIHYQVVDLQSFTIHQRIFFTLCY